MRDGGGSGRLYRAPAAVIRADTVDQVGGALKEARRALREGGHLAGFIGYEAGHALEPRAPARAGGLNDPPLLWFGVFHAVESLLSEQVARLLPDPHGAYAGLPSPRVDEAAYAAAFSRVAEYIRAGDIYQANLSFRADVPVAGDPLALYARLRAASSAGWGGVVFTGTHWLLSASPELFFTLADGAITARPMKGTTPRRADAQADALAAAALQVDQKERAENLMIVDLLRNDIARVAVAGSVAVPALFTVETYPTLHTLTSTVTARLAPERDAVDAVEALFPCGSVTGAPKIRAMQIIGEVEGDARGAYTGSIGWLDPAGDAAFNVAIRTLVLADGASRATLGLGSAVVADSTAAAEWRECLAKAAFVTHGAPEIVLIETMRAEQGGVRDLLRHLARLRASAATLGFAFGPQVEGAIGAAVADLIAPSRLRLTLARDGATEIILAPLPAPPDQSVEVALAPLPVAAGDYRLRHKTSDRAFYDDARNAAGAFEVAFVDAAGFLTEGSFTSLFVERDDVLLTPPLARGLLPGVLRARLIEEGRAVEADLTPDDLAEGFLLGNALRGLIPARLAGTSPALHDAADSTRLGHTR